MLSTFRLAVFHEIRRQEEFLLCMRTTHTDVSKTTWSHITRRYSTFHNVNCNPLTDKGSCLPHKKRGKLLAIIERLLRQLLLDSFPSFWQISSAWLLCCSQLRLDRFESTHRQRLNRLTLQKIWFDCP